MSTHAAIIRSFDHPPRYERCDPPGAVEPGDAVVEVLAAGLHPRVRSDAAGRHYMSTGALPMIPGIDGVGRLPDGQNVYFVVTQRGPGSMADRAVADLRRVVPLPEGADPAQVAAAVNPAMSSWLALRRRAALQPGQDVLVLGATGVAGGAAVQVAKRLGAGRVIAAGRNRDRLGEVGASGADEVVSLGGGAATVAGALAAAAAEVDVVVDYLWGDQAQTAMAAILDGRADRSRALDWVQVGAMAGPTLELPSAALRSANLRIQGTGQGAVSAGTYLAELPGLLVEIAAGAVGVRVRQAPLTDIETLWSEPLAPGERMVLIP